MIKNYKNRLLLQIIMFGFIVFSIITYIPDDSDNNNIGVSEDLVHDNFTFYISQSLYYPDDEILYLYYQQTLTNNLYIGSGNKFEVVANYNTNNQFLIQESTSSIEGTNTLLLKMDKAEYEKLKSISILFSDGDTNTLLMGSLEYKKNMVSYEDLANFATTPKIKIEKENEIAYFKYLYSSDPLWTITEIEKSGGINSFFKGNINSQHKQLADILLNESWTESKNDEVMLYFQDSLNNELFSSYFEATAKSEKQSYYTKAVEEMIKRLNQEMSTFEKNLIDAKYMTQEEITEFTAGMNIQQKYLYLKEKNSQLLKDLGVENNRGYQE